MQPRSLALLISTFATAVSAHFQLQFPPPRGAFNENSETVFCDGYNTVAANRETFPLSGGFFSLNSEHPQFTTGVFFSTAGNPTSFDNFTQVVPFFQTNGEGLFCFPLDFSSLSDPTGLQSGQNITIQIEYQATDGSLFQCADLTLANNFTISSDVPCTNATNSTSAAVGNGLSVGIAGLLLGAFGVNVFILESLT